MPWTPPSFPMQYPDRPSPLGPAASPPPPDYAPGADELSRLVELGVLSEEEAENIRQQKLAEGSAAAAGPEGRQVGGVYVAASPLEHAAGLAGRGASAYRLAQLRRERESLTGLRRAGLRAEQDIGQQTLGYPAPFGF